ncbi:MAG: type II toxin-antitoxin system Phd/YefM family antitoxin [Planctomycetota bacterium]
MKTVNIHDAKTHFAHLLRLVARGEEVIIARRGKPVARLVRYTSVGTQRRGGAWRGLVRIGDDFDAPLPEEVEAAFRGERP